VAQFEKKPQDANACLKALYAALALRDGDLTARTRKALAEGAEKRHALFALAAQVLNPQPDGAALTKLVQDRGNELRGDDCVFLAALACRRGGGGGDTWNAFRAAAPDLLGRQQVSGSVIVLVNGLSRTALPLR
jgi:hypothetical protein